MKRGFMNQTRTVIGTILKALEMAAHKHNGQKRKDKDESPYIIHPIDLANVICNEAGITDEDVLCAALLHDTIEDTETTYLELVDLFGKTIADIVQEVSDNKMLPPEVRKEMQIEHAAHLSYQAKLVKLADKISNLRDIVSSPPVSWDIKRKQEYFDWAKKVVDQLRGTNTELERIFDGLYAKGVDQ
jgi:guanosine-3',5'-bis(diphosphate) 3'-pyrophosphohydrolase